ncbi:MAG: sensor domain-containing diguanylate cyclase [Betaproteobacteria bacterium HGW-Betaproteobacteria-12]|nr:MAG: sensor domain-containing diguanylate cyclase [Betaproteobacteria bacterium HGW-Betaproteobacteria-12]
MNQLSLGVRLALGFLIVALLPLAGLAWFYLHTFEQALATTVLQNITSIADKKTQQIDQYINERLADARLYASRPELRDALARHGAGAPTAALGAALQGELAALGERGAYHDVLLIDAAGNVVFSLRGESDLHTNLLHGPYRDSGLASGFRQAMTFLHIDLTRFAPYAPSANRAAAFAVAPVLDRGKAVGALALQIDLATLMPVVADRTGLGASGETVMAVREGKRVRYTVPLARLPAPPFSRLVTDEYLGIPMQRALAGDNGRGIATDYAGQLVVANWSHLPALGWGMVVKIDVAEALAPLHARQRLTVLVFLAFLLLSAAIALLLGRRFIRSESIIATQEVRYRAMFGSMNDGVALYRPTANGEEFILLDINPAGERITGVARAAVVGQRSRVAFPGLEAAGIYAAFRRVAASGQRETVSLTTYHDQRVDLWVETEVIRLPSGDLLSVLKDITARQRAEAALVESLDNLREAQRIAQIGNWRLDLASNQLYWSEEVFRIFEIDPQRFPATYESFVAAIHPDDRDAVDRAYRASLEKHEPYEFTHRLLFADGRIKYVHEHGETQFAADGTALLSHGTVQDITEHQQAEETLELYANVFQHSGEAIMVTDHDNRIVAVNPAFSRQTGYTLAEVAGKNPRLLAAGRTTPETYTALWAALAQSGYWQGELWDRNRDGRIYPKWAVISAIRDARGEITHYIASFTDISDRKAAEERIEHLAHHDSLTGLFNRYNLEIRLSQALLSARREQHFLAVLFIDLDRFKVINDTLGHHTGDQLLVEVARRLKGCVRESDIVARQGGDEFVVVLSGLAVPADASPPASKILQALAEPYEIAGDRLHSSPSIGIAIFPGDGDDAGTLMKHADAAMYHAKEQGRNNLQYFTAELNAAASERLLLERELRIAIETRQFELHYQPQFTADGPFDRPFAVEALVRWRHPQRGLIPPDRFIPVAEETGLIEAIGDWVLHEACNQLAQWKAEGIGPQRVAVNISAHQLRTADLVERVAEVLQRYRLAHDELELEITESVAMSDPASAIERLDALRELGVTLAIDDFGTGYSSLAYLKRLPIQVLKLDRAFVRDIETDENDAAISAATLALAHSLGLKVVAEGIETEGQSRFLRQHGCDLLQGYLYGRPEPAAALAERWRAACPLTT